MLTLVIMSKAFSVFPFLVQNPDSKMTLWEVMK